MDKIDKNNDFNKLLLAILTMLILIGSMLLGVYFISKNKELISLFHSYFNQFTIPIILSLFVGVSLIAIVILFGFLKSNSFFYKKKNRSQGAIAGFLTILTILISSFEISIIIKSVLPNNHNDIEISGNLCFEGDSNPIFGATVSILRIPGGPRTETDKNGNFQLKVPTDNINKMDKVEFTVEYKGNHHTEKIKRSEIEKPITITFPQTVTQLPITEISGNVCAAGTARPIFGATVSILKISGGPRTETDKNGNFQLKVPTDNINKMDEVEFIVEYKGNHHTEKIKRSEIEKPITITFPQPVTSTRTSLPITETTIPVPSTITLSPTTISTLPPPIPYIKNKDGTVINRSEKLMWTAFKTSYNGRRYMSWEDAFYCAGEANKIRLNGYRNWRLPAKEELIDLAKFIKNNPNFFQDVDKSYWTDDEKNGLKAWAVESGEPLGKLKTESHAVRLVRSIE